MKDIDRAAEIVKSSKKRFGSTCNGKKFRKGWNKDSVNAVEFAVAMEQAGADAVAVHGRTKDQMYSGKADWDIIKKSRKAFQYP